MCRRQSTMRSSRRCRLYPKSVRMIGCAGSPFLPVRYMTRCFRGTSVVSPRPVMKGLLDKAFRRWLYILASLAILGLQVCAYSALLVLWRTNALGRLLFSSERLNILSQIVSVVSQTLAISSLAALTFFVQAVASDRIIRRRACLRHLSTLYATITDVFPAY